MTNEGYVVFETADGEEVSNDPRWLAERTLKAAGVEVANDNSAELQATIDAKDAEIEALRVALAASQLTESLEEDEEKPTGDYSDVTGKDLTALAKERNIALKDEAGKAKTAGTVRAELIAQDLAKA